MLMLLYIGEKGHIIGVVFHATSAIHSDVIGPAQDYLEAIACWTISKSIIGKIGVIVDQSITEYDGV